MTRCKTTENAMQPDDHALIRAVIAGDTTAFDRLVYRHQDRVYNLCYWFLGEAAEAEDAAQDVFVRAYRSLPGFRFQSQFATWIYRIAVNTCKNRLKSVAYRIKKWTRDIAADDGVAVASLADADTHHMPSPEAALQKAQTTDAIRRAMDRLAADRKTVVVLRDIEGLSYEEISAITGWKPGTVKSKLFRARQDLKYMLKDRM
ncbi:MAG: sigma-70 family RNA polymerase sigma factor [Thermodesulfobacteriota bacterium]